jgi:putative nucleotidyltransferase-like protein
MAGADARKAEGLLARARTLSSDAAAVEVAEAFGTADVPVILLKGPVLANWLYPGEERVYRDADLLVPRERLRQAEEVLARLGFEAIDEGLEQPARGLLHSRPWLRERDLAQIDLHMTLHGVGVAPEETWVTLSKRTERMSLADVDVDVLEPPARALHVALHALQHEDRRGTPLEDLARALDRVPLAVWAEAAKLAESLDASPTFALGLARLPEGAVLARRLGVVSPELARAATRQGSAATLAVGFDRLSRADGLRAKAGVVVMELVPSRSFMRWWSPLARRGRAGLALAYVWRPLWLLLHAPPSLAAWRRHRRRA